MRYPFDKFVLGTRYSTKGKAWKCGWHSGVDFKSTNYGGDGKIYPLYAGMVQKITTQGSYGNCVYVKHPDGYVTLYAHMKKFLVRVGQQVTESTCLGIEGTTGNSTGLHCHVEVHKGSYHYPASIDPLAFIKQRMSNAEGGDKMNQKEFDKMMSAHQAAVAKNPPQPWSAEARKWAEQNKIITGNGNGMAYQSPVTREELVAILYRLEQKNK